MPAVAANKPTPKPNIIVIFTDDQTYRAIGYNTPAVKTPHLDALAASGLTFEHAYVASPICAASRASMMTGLFPQQHGVTALKQTAFSPYRIGARSAKQTLPNRLKKAGYFTAFYGKSHLGKPLTYGFDTGDELPVNDGEPDGDSDDEPTLEPGDEPLGAGPYPIADITFEVDAGDGTTTYRLACLGDTATFTGDTALSADQACLALNDLDVRTRLLTDDHLDRMCTEQYGGPQIATVTGTLDDEPVDATIDRANGCGIDDWDRLLTAVLPPAT